MCCKEVLYFHEREKVLGRADLIFPFTYVDVDPSRRSECQDEAVFDLLRTREAFDFHDLIYHPVDSPDVKRRISKLATAIDIALRRWVSGEGASVSEARQRSVPALVRTIVASSDPQPFTVIRDIPDGPELVLILQGSFTMGVPPQEEEREGVPEANRGWSLPRQSVAITQPFWLGQYPVTRHQLATFVAENGHRVPDEAWTYESDERGRWDYKTRQNRNWRNPGFEQTDDHPVVCVSHADVMACLNWLSRVTGQPYRLPSEAEWEYAARAATTTARYWGDDRNSAVRYAKVADRSLMARMKKSFDPDRFFDGDSGYLFTTPVQSFLPNQFGLFDMLGNVWEWTVDCWNESLKGMPSDGSARTTGDCSRRVLCGGAWFNDPRYVRAGVRYWDSSSDRYNFTGFRVARTCFRS